MNNKPIDKEKSKSDHTKTKKVRIDCLCDKDLTIDDLLETFKNQKKTTLEKFLPEINKTLNRYNINTCLRRSHFLAQVGHESGELTYTSEVLPNGKKESEVYDGYKGRGLIQLTFKANYKAYGDYISKNLLESNKIKLEGVDLATDSAGWFWTQGKGINLNDLADRNDLIAITIAINGGFNGYNHRHELLKNIADTLNLSACKNLKTIRELMPIEAENSFSTKKYELAESTANNSHRSAFAWGYWHSSETKRKGTEKSETESANGYRRFLELNEAKPYKKKAFGLTAEKMVEIAKKTKEKK